MKTLRRLSSLLTAILFTAQQVITPAVHAAEANIGGHMPAIEIPARIGEIESATPGKSGAPVIVVTPVVGTKALRGTAGKMMRELGREPSPRGVAGEYLRLIDGFVIDREDAAAAEGVRSLGLEVLAVPTVMRNDDDRVALAQAVLGFAAAIRERRAAEVE